MCIINSFGTLAEAAVLTNNYFSDETVTDLIAEETACPTSIETEPIVFTQMGKLKCLRILNISLEPHNTAL